MGTTLVEEISKAFPVLLNTVIVGHTDSDYSKRLNYGPKNENDCYVFDTLHRVLRCATQVITAILLK